MSIQLKGGHVTRDPRLDRVPQFDERSRGFAVIETLSEGQLAKPRGYTWRVGVNLDQGQEGACVGFSIAQEGAARPAVIPSVTNDVARSIYQRAKQLDEWPGEDYEGTSVLAGMKAATERGWYGEYRWAFGLDDLIVAVGYKGPAVLGIHWYESMFRPDGDGVINVTGDVAGGHAILCHAVSVRERVFWLWNSWGEGWGQGGRAKISFADVDRLLHEDGEACVPVKRYRV